MSFFNVLTTIISNNKNTIAIEEAEKYGWIPLQLVCFNSDLEQYLKSNLATTTDDNDFVVQDSNGNTALHLLARGLNDDDEQSTAVLMSHLLKIHHSKVSLTMCNKQGLTPLQEAAYYNNKKMLALLKK
jgi:ankyrin repeat protein